MPKNANDPFFGEAPETLPLNPDPLSGVLAQVRFPEIFSIEKKEFIADFQERMRQSYPISAQERSVVLKVGPEGAQQRQTPNWRFFDEARTWRLSLTTSFVALETRSYTNRTDFVSRMQDLALALDETVRPGKMNRIGVRYVDRVHGDQFNRLDSLVRNEVLGLGAQAHRDKVVRSVTESLCVTAEGQMITRWGMMPAMESHDHDLMPPINQPSWFLDTDVFAEFDQVVDFSSEVIGSKVMQLATRAYCFFRWAVNDEFLKSYGGKL